VSLPFRGGSRWWETASKDGSDIIRKERTPTANDRYDTDWDEGGMVVHSPLRPLIDDRDGYVVLGRSESSHRKWRKKATLDLGEVGEHQEDGEDLNGRRVFIDAAFPHIIFICGKRGSGKSYTLGVLAEELARSAIGVGVVLIDPIGIFWSLKKENESVRERQELVRWGLSPHSFPEVRVLVPGNPESLALGAADGPFTIGVNEMTAEDWCQVFDMDRFKTQGLLIGAAIDQVRMGYTAIGESGSFRVIGKADRYSLGDLINCIRSSDSLTSKEVGYTPQTRRSLIARFAAAGGWGIFSVDGTPLSDVSSPNRVTVIDISDPELGDDKRSLITGIVARKILSARIYSARMEEAGTSETPDPERIPVTWLMLDEAHVILPHGRQTPATDALIEYAKQGRRPGCALVLATQRPASTSDEILSQVDVLIGHNLALEDDMTALRRRVPAKLPPEFANSDFIRAIPVGTAIVADQRTQQRSFLVRLRPRMSHHAGSSAMPSALAEKKDKVTLPISATVSSFHDRTEVMRPTDAETLHGGKGGSNDQEVGKDMTAIGPEDTKNSDDPTDGPKVDPLSQLKDGNTAMLVSSNVQGLSERAMGIWKDRRFIIVSRLHPTVYPGMDSLETEKVFWLSSTPSEISVSPNAIQDLLVDIGRSLDTPGKKAVLFDGLETLSTENDKRSVLRFFQAMRERVFLGGHILLIRVDSDLWSDTLETLSREMDLVLNENEVDAASPQATSSDAGPERKVNDIKHISLNSPLYTHDVQGSLGREDLKGMCRLIGISDEGTDQEILSRLVSLQGEGSPDGSGLAPDTIFRIGEMARMMRENSDLRDRIQTLESELGNRKDRSSSSEGTLEGGMVDGEDVPGTNMKGRTTLRKTKVVWEPETAYNEIKSLRESMQRITSDISEMKERFIDVRSDPIAGDEGRAGDLLERIMRDLDGKRADELERIEGLEETLKRGLSRIGSAFKDGTGVAGDIGTTAKPPPDGSSARKKGAGPGTAAGGGRTSKKLKVEKVIVEVPMISSVITPEQAALAVKRTLKRSFFKGPLETVTSVEPAYLPLTRCLVNYRSGITSSIRSGDVYFDTVCGEMVVSYANGLERTRSISLLLTLSPLERKVFDRLGSRSEEDVVIADSSGVTKAQSKRALGSLVKKGIAQTTAGEGNVLLYCRARQFEMDERPWKKDPPWHPRSAPLPKERVLPALSDERLPEMAMGLIRGGVRMMDKDRVLYPVYIVKVAGEGRTRHCFVDALSGRIDPDLTEISKNLL
jgi:hypothetical protein